MTDEQDVRRLLSAAVRGEPPLALDRAAVFAEGRRRLRVRRTATVGGAAVAVVAVVLGMSALSGAQFGMRGDVGPAAPPAVPVPATIGAPATTSPPPVATTPVAEPSVTSTERPEATRSPTAVDPAVRGRLGVVLRDAKIPWPPGVSVAGDGAEWFAFDESGTATFHLVAKDAARRIVSVRVFAGAAPPVACGEGCRLAPAPDGSLVSVRYAKPAGSGGPVSVEVATTPGAGAGVRVVETAGFGPPWQAEPLLPDDVLVAIATIPGLAAVNR